jgi:hypothetical protein
VIRVRDPMRSSVQPQFSSSMTGDGACGSTHDDPDASSNPGDPDGPLDHDGIQTEASFTTRTRTSSGPTNVILEANGRSFQARVGTRIAADALQKISAKGLAVDLNGLWHPFVLTSD